MAQSQNSTSFYVIASKGSSELITNVMHAGPDGEEEAIAVFTQQAKALEYLNQAGWVETDTVAELGPQSFLRWLLKSIDSGPKLVAIDPDRVQQDDKIRQSVMPVSELMKRLGPAINECLTASELTPAQ